MREKRQAVADRGYAQFGQQFDRIFIERVCRSDPAIRANLLALEDFESADKFGALFLNRNSSEFAVVVQADDAGVPVDVSMLIPVQSDGPVPRLPSSHHIPESLVTLALVQSRIGIVRYDRQDRTNILLDHDLL